jgi:hypothetical protein
MKGFIMSPWELYWLLKLDDVGSLFQMFAVIIGFGCLIGLGGFIGCLLEKSSTDSYNDPDKYDTPIKILKKILWICLPIEFILIIGATFLPTTKQMATIIVVPKVINSVQNNKALMELPNEVATLASSWIKELRPENFNKVPADTIKEQ